MRSSPFFFRALLAFLLGAAPAFAPAQSWPDKPIRFVMSAPAGSSIDVLGRTIADKLKDRLGQPVIVENKPAAGGTVATAEVAKAAPDGYTMVLAFNGPLSITPLLSKVPYDVQKDLAPVIITSSQPNVLAVTAQLPVKTVQELVAYARANPGKLNFASVGNGSSSHLNAELLKSMAGIDIVHIPFNGSPPAVTATIQNETQMIFAVMQPLQPQIQAGKLRALAVTSAKRFPLCRTCRRSPNPAIPASMRSRGTACSFRPPRRSRSCSGSTPRSTRYSRTRTSCRKCTQSGFDLVGGTPEEFGALIKTESEKWVPVIRKAGVRVD